MSQDNYSDYNSDYYSYTDNYPNLDLHRANSYKILKEDQIMKERDDIIKQAIEFTELSRGDAILVLIYYNWSIDSLRDNWYDNPELISIKSGIKIPQEEKKKNSSDNLNNINLFCLICYTSEDKTFHNLKCGHKFCGDCWGEYLEVKVEDFLVCLSTTCPQNKCNQIVPEELFFTNLKSINSKEKFNKAILKNFTSSNTDIKLCSSPHCNIAIKCDSHTSKEISCLCGIVFCFRCSREAHRPCECFIIDRWELRSKSDTENDKWIQANTKTCPHCNQRIEKNQGCNHMLCNKSAGGCGKAFCYVCEVDWEKHSQDHFKCNMYTPEIKAKENKAEKLKAELLRYKFYFERFMNYNQAVKFAEKLSLKLDHIIEYIIKVKFLPLSELEFMKDALKTVISSKRTLKNTYIFGYYLKDEKEKKLFEYSQSFLERNSDNLHQMIEQDSLTKLIQEDNYEIFNKTFTEFKNTVVNLCHATTKYQNNLMNEIETTYMPWLDENLLYEK